MKLVGEANNRNRALGYAANRRLLVEARGMLQRVVQMDAPRARLAWAWYDLGRVLRSSSASWAEIRHAFERAVELEPGNDRFVAALNAPLTG